MNSWSASAPENDLGNLAGKTDRISAGRPCCFIFSPPSLSIGFLSDAIAHHDIPRFQEQAGAGDRRRTRDRPGNY